MDDPDYRLWQRIERVPVLALLATWAAILDLVLDRVSLRLLGSAVPRATLLAIAGWSDLPRNLFAVAGIVALLVAIVPLMTARGPAAVARSLGLAGFSGFFVLMLTLVTLLPSQQLSKVSVGVLLLASTLAAHMLAATVALSASLRSSPRGIRWSLLILALASVTALSATTLNQVPSIVRSQTMNVLAGAMHSITEAAYVLVPIVMGITLLRPVFERRAWRELAPGLCGVFAVVALFAWGLGRPMEFRDVLYGAFGWRSALESAPALYALPMMAYGAVACIALRNPDGAYRQAGAGLALLLAGGLVPSTPARLLMWVLGVALVARSSIVFGERVVAARSD